MPAEETPVLRALRRRVRVFCWIMTTPENTHKARAVHRTWAARCDQHLFVSAAPEAGLPSVDLDVTAGRKHLWDKTRRAFAHVHRVSLGAIL